MNIPLLVGDATTPKVATEGEPIVFDDETRGIWAEASWGDSEASQSTSSEIGPSLV